jgi:hypothetical protein
MFTLEFDTDNAAFTDGEMPTYGTECARILRAIAEQLERGSTGGAAVDVNGNTVGRWELDYAP